MVVTRRPRGGILPAAILCAALFLPGTTSAQDQATEPPTPRRILVSVQKGPLAGVSSEALAVLQRSFLTTLSLADGAPSPVAFGQNAFPGSQADRDAAARAAGADCWLLVRIAGSRARPVIRVDSYDLLYETHTLAFTVTRREPFPIMDINRERWNDVVPLVVRTYPALDPVAYSRGATPPVTLTVKGLPGTMISGLTARPVTVGTEGTVSIELPSPAPYKFRATLAGYIPSPFSFYLDGERQITLTQVRAPWLFFDLGFLDGLYPGVSATLATSPFPGFLRLGFTTFRAGIAFNQDQLFSSLPLSQVTLLLGVYLSPEDLSTRWYLGAGPLLRLSVPPDAPLTIDGLLPGAIQLVGGVEFSLVTHLRVFVEWAPSGYYTPEPALFLGYYGDNSTMPYFLLGPVALNPFELRVGVRWVL
jgi:hypothetical protein